MKESTKEFIGITPASLLVTFGFLLVFGVIYLKFNVLIASFVFLLGFILTGYGLYIDFKKKDQVGWRKTNKALHIVMLIFMILGTLFYYFLM